jgi:S1-C subfamily serine protease
MRHVAVASTVGAVIMLFTGFAVASEDVTPESRSAGQEIYARSLPAIVTLESRNKDGSSSIGSAFLAIRDGVAVTAWHTVGDALEVIARFSSGEVFEVSGLIDKDERRDVALIRIKVFGRPLLSLSADEPAIGSRAYVIGAPRGLEYTISEGIVSQKQLVEGIEQYQFSCAASPGNSGGPLLDDKGVVL